MNSTPDLDVLVLGAGPAGYSTAIMLAQSGQHVQVLTRHPSDQHPMRFRIGESLSPAANQVLRQLGIWESFIADGHLACYGNKSSWGRAELQYYDFINDPNGHGWHIDRALFEKRLAERTSQIGVKVISSGSLKHVTWDGKRWQLELPGGKRLSAKYMVDATGRASWFARRQGAKRIRHDSQVALVAFLKASGPSQIDSTSFVESVPNGWWYSAAIPGQRLAVAFFTDIDLIDARIAASPRGWQKLLNSTRYMHHRVNDHDYELELPPRFVSAHSGRLDRIEGLGWLAVGDAAICYDPLSAHGLTVALASGRDAVQAISSTLAGNPDSQSEYARQMFEAFSTYSKMRTEHYTTETRWPQNVFWRRRARQKGP